MYATYLQSVPSYAQLVSLVSLGKEPLKEKGSTQKPTLFLSPVRAAAYPFPFLLRVVSLIRDFTLKKKGILFVSLKRKKKQPVRETLKRTLIKRNETHGTVFLLREKDTSFPHGSFILKRHSFVSFRFFSTPSKEPSSKETKRGAAHRPQPLKKPSSKETKRGAVSIFCLVSLLLLFFCLVSLLRKNKNKGYKKRYVLVSFISAQQGIHEATLTGLVGRPPHGFF